ncbi:MAG: hypothetical protein FWD99_09170 [Oscillospiraceae bacterium]|nr:hypothetical protein [Oscillospiraceae bacterium]
MDTKSRLFSLIDAQYPSYATFEQDLNLPARTTNNWKMGKSKSYLKMLPQLASALNTTSSYLLGETPIQNRPHTRISDWHDHTRQKTLENLTRYKIPPIFGQLLKQKIFKDGSCYEDTFQYLLERLETTHPSRIDEWIQGEGDMSDYEYRTFCDVFDIPTGDQKEKWPENISDFENIQKSDNTPHPETSKTLDEVLEYNEEAKKIIQGLSQIEHLFIVLNTDGQAKLLEYAHDIIKIPEYKRRL